MDGNITVKPINGEMEVVEFQVDSYKTVPFEVGNC